MILGEDPKHASQLNVNLSLILVVVDSRIQSLARRSGTSCKRKKREIDFKKQTECAAGETARQTYLSASHVPVCTKPLESY